MTLVDAALMPRSPFSTVSKPSLVTVDVPPNAPNGAAAPRSGAVGQTAELLLKVETRLPTIELPAKSLTVLVIVSVKLPAPKASFAAKLATWETVS